MKYYIYANYNKKVEAYERPLILMDDENEYIERIGRDFKASGNGEATPSEAQQKIAEYTINLIGYYDDTTGKITLCEPNCIFDCGSLIQKGDQDGTVC